MGMERPVLVEEPLCLLKGLGGGDPQIVRHRRHPFGAARQRAAEPVAGPRVPGPTGLVPITFHALNATSPPDHGRWALSGNGARCPA
ncbi:hypothetical protein GCM10010399_76080 [Dactylosporangium fulvum]